MDKFGVYFSTALGVGIITFLAVCWHDITTLQKLVGVYFIAISIHVWEEMKLPGGFIDLVTENLKFNLKNVGAAKLLLFLVEILIAIVPLFFSQVIWLCVAPLILGFVETFAHLAATRMNKKQKFYSPGMITALCIMLPVSAYGFYYIIANGIMEHGIWWLWSVLYLLGIVVVAQMIIVKSNGMKYSEFLGNARKKMFGKAEKMES